MLNHNNNIPNDVTLSIKLNFLNANGIDVCISGNIIALTVGIIIICITTVLAKLMFRG